MRKAGANAPAEFMHKCCALPLCISSILLNFKSIYINVCATFVQLYIYKACYPQSRKPLQCNTFYMYLYHQILPPTQKTVGSNPAGCATQKPLSRNGSGVFLIFAFIQLSFHCATFVQLFLFWANINSISFFA